MPENYRLIPPVAFAHRGAKAHAPENTLEAFALALKLGANGLESDVWLTSDGIAVLDHDGAVRSGLRKRPIASLLRSDLPAHIPTLQELYDTCGANYELSLDLKDPNALGPVNEVAANYEQTHGVPVLERLWLCHPSLDDLRRWRTAVPTMKLVLSTKKDNMAVGPERCAADMASGGLDAVNLHHSEWTLGLTTLFHRFELSTFGWDAQYVRTIKSVLGMEIDGVYSDHVDLMVDAFRERYGKAPNE